MDRDRTSARIPFVTFVPPVTLGVLADTHVGDRSVRLPQEVLEVFARAGVHAILHAGDVTHPQVLEELAKVAPVYAVRGNRDFLLWRRLPYAYRFGIGSQEFVLVHGHGSLLRYLVDKVSFLAGYPLSFRTFENRAATWFPEAHVVIMGHTHAPTLRRIQGRWIFNPGSPTVPPAQPTHLPRTVGLVHVRPSGETTFEFVFLGGKR